MTDVSLRDNEIVADEQLSDLPTAVATLARHLESAIGGHVSRCDFDRTQMRRRIRASQVSCLPAWAGDWRHISLTVRLW